MLPKKQFVSIDVNFLKLTSVFVLTLFIVFGILAQNAKASGKITGITPSNNNSNDSGILTAVRLTATQAILEAFR